MIAWLMIAGLVGGMTWIFCFLAVVLVRWLRRDADNESR